MALQSLALEDFDMTLAGEVAYVRVRGQNKGKHLPFKNLPR